MMRLEAAAPESAFAPTTLAHGSGFIFQHLSLPGQITALLSQGDHRLIGDCSSHL